ncbi:MAG: PhzF family phenazine biosynthesis protein [Synechococcales bacterium]|nr:PhzF family phenazine biosynthesis protein [Synechococcales bacterium]
MALTLLQVDAFTNQPFSGNPAAVCILPSPPPAVWMQQVAREMNLSETAFLVPGEGGFNLRWFTPTVEVDLCGHATLASAHVLWSEGHWPSDQPAQFHTRSGLLTAVRRADWIDLDFPASVAIATAPPAGLAQALGIQPVLVAITDSSYLLVEVDSPTVVRSLQPDFGQLREIPVHGIIVTSRGETPYDFVSRFFAPRMGIDEDPVTGSAHCVLAPFWCDRLQQTECLGYQASARGGVVKVCCQGDRVILSGQAVTVLRGELLPPPIV